MVGGEHRSGIGLEISRSLQVESVGLENVPLVPPRSSNHEHAWPLGRDAPVRGHHGGLAYVRVSLGDVSNWRS